MGQCPLNSWQEVGQKVDRVDDAINVLITAGLSSPNLRLAAERGVDIRSAGHVSWRFQAKYDGKNH